MDIIPVLFNLYDESEKKLNKYKNSEFNYYYDNSLKKSLVEIKSGSKKKQLRSETVGVYFKKSKIFVWNWVLAEDKETTNYSFMLLNYAVNLDRNQYSREDYRFVRDVLTSSRISVEEDYNMEILIGLILYITSNNVLHRIVVKTKNEDLVFYNVILEDLK